MRPIPSLAVGFVQTQEGKVLRVYDDKNPQRILKPGDTVEGVLTGGWGHTGGLEIGQEVTLELATKWLHDDLAKKAAIPLARKIGAVVDDLTDHQYAALLSFIFNLGTGDSKKPEWTIWKRLRAKQFDQVPGEINKFVNWGGKKSEALAARRGREVALWSTAEPGSVPQAPPSSVTRREATPPTPSDPVAPAKSATIITGCLSACASVGVAAKTVTDTIMPFQYASPVVGQAVATIATIAAAAAVIVLVLSWLKKREART